MKSLTVVSFLVLAGSLVAQTPQTGAQQSDAKTKPAEKISAAPETSQPKASLAGEMPKPAPEMERLTKMLQGRWTTEEKHEPSEMMPQGGSGKGQESVRPGPGKLSLISEYTSQGPMGEFSGIGIITWDPVERLYHIHWTDNTSSGVSIMNGKWVGQDLVFTGSDMMMGKKVYSRHAFSEMTSEAFTYTIDTGTTPNQLKRAVTIKYTKLDRQKVMQDRMRRLSGRQ